VRSHVYGENSIQWSFVAMSPKVRIMVILATRHSSRLYVFHRKQHSNSTMIWNMSENYFLHSFVPEKLTNLPIRFGLHRETPANRSIGATSLRTAIGDYNQTPAYQKLYKLKDVQPTVLISKTNSQTSISPSYNLFRKLFINPATNHHHVHQRSG
jgi:hypothetical protein